MNKFLILIGWRRGPDSIPFGQASFARQLGVVAGVVAVVVITAHFGL